MNNNDETFTLTPEGQKIVASALTKAEQLGLINFSKVTSTTAPEYCKVLAEEDELWDSKLDGENRSETIDNRKVMLAFGLAGLIKKNLSLN